MNYRKHYIRIDERNCIIKGFSDAFVQPLETDICINETGLRHFRLTPDGVDNPPLFDDEYGIPLYKWENESIVARSIEEFENDIPEDDTDDVWAELDKAYQEGVNSI